MRIPKNYIIFYSINLYKSNIFSIKKKKMNFQHLCKFEIV